MRRAGLAIWLAAALVWTGYFLEANRDKLSGLSEREWSAAFTYGTNNLLCDLHVPRLCRSLYVPALRQSELSATFSLIEVFFLAPAAALVLLAALGIGLRMLLGLPVLLLAMAAAGWIATIALQGR